LQVILERAAGNGFPETTRASVETVESLVVKGSGQIDDARLLETSQVCRVWYRYYGINTALFMRSSCCDLGRGGSTAPWIPA
jgi:hypothetical protein